MTTSTRPTGALSGLFGFFAGIMVMAMAGAFLWLWSGARAEGPHIDTSRLTVVRQVQQLARLESVVFGMDKIVAGGEENKYLPQFLVGDRLLLMAYGEAIAGVDLGKLEESAVELDGETLRLTLPEPELFVVRVDNERTRVYSRQTGLFTRVDPHLETEARRAAERQLRQAAIDNGILKLARDHARSTLTAFVTALGFTTVDVR
jgi:hypothetical protein